MSDEIAVKKRGGNNGKSPVIGDNALMVGKGDIASFIQSMTRLRRLPMVKTDEEVEERIDLYFQWCIESDMKPGVEGLALALGISRKTLWDWQQGTSWSDSKRAELVMQAKQIISCSLEQLIMQNKINVIGGIFMMKNHFNYQDKTEMEINTNTPLGRQLTPDEIMRQLPQDIPADVEYLESFE